MADAREPIGRDALAEGAERLDKIVRSLRNRQIIQVGNRTLVPSSTLYQRLDPRFSRPNAVKSPVWAAMPVGGSDLATKKAGKTGWRQLMPLPVRWVMGWP